MERNFLVIPILRNFRPTSRGTPKISEWNSGKCLFHSLPNPEFPEFLVEWKAPHVFWVRIPTCTFTNSPFTRTTCFIHFFESLLRLTWNLRTKTTLWLSDNYSQRLCCTWQLGSPLERERSIPTLHASSLQIRRRAHIFQPSSVADAGIA